MTARIRFGILHALLFAMIAVPSIAAADRDESSRGRFNDRSVERDHSRNESFRPLRNTDRPGRAEPSRRPATGYPPMERRENPRSSPTPVAPRARESGRTLTQPTGTGQRELRRTTPKSSPTWRKPAPSGYVQDKRHSHNQYYPPQGSTVRKLPSGHRDVEYRGSHYHFHNGVWYRPANGVYVVTRPPVGLTLRFLPPFHTVVWVGTVPYYYAAGVYYVWYSEFGYYRVVDAPRETDARDHGATDELYVYPRNGQDAEQQAQDKYECHQWAKGQTGFDPTEPGGNVPTTLYNAKRADYRRAMKACLEARSYSVQ